MHYRKLGKTELDVSLVSFGSGGPSKLGQNTGLSSNEQNDLIRNVLDSGINLIDSSEGYGESEAILGRALLGSKRDSYILATKCLYKSPEGGMRRPGDLKLSIDRCLERLSTDYIDIMQFHVLNSSDYFQVVDELYPVMEKAKEEGKIRFIGFSEQFKTEPDHRVVKLALTAHPGLWDTVMLKYGILNQYAAKEALPLCKKHNIGVINMAVIREKLPNPQLLAEQIKIWKAEGRIEESDISEDTPLDWLIHGDVQSVVDAGYKFAADHNAISTVLTGTSSTRHLRANIDSLETPSLPNSDRIRLERLFGEIAIYI